MSRRTETAYKAKFPGKLARHNEARGSGRYGKCCGCVAKVHVLIRGDLLNMQLTCVFMSSGESAGWGNRLTKSRRFKISFHLEASETRKQAGWRCKIREEPRLVGQLTG